MTKTRKPKWDESRRAAAYAIAIADVIYLSAIGPALISAKDSIYVIVGFALGALLLGCSLNLFQAWRKSHG